MNADALDILRKVESGELSVEEGARRLQELESPGSAAGVETSETIPAVEPVAVRSQVVGQDFAPDNTSAAADPQVIEAQPQENLPPDLGWWKKGWLIPFWIGTGILVLGSLMMGWAYSSQKFFWFYCSWLPMLGGMLVLILSWWSQQARWVHVRVNDADGSKVSISMPLPLGLAGWAFRLFGRYIPHMEKKVLDDLPGMLEALAKEKGPTTVEVDDKDGSKVRVYIV